MTKRYRYHSRHQANATSGVLLVFVAIIAISLILRVPLRVWLVLGGVTITLIALIIVVALVRDQRRQSEDGASLKKLQDDEIERHRSFGMTDEEIERYASLRAAGDFEGSARYFSECMGRVVSEDRNRILAEVEEDNARYAEYWARQERP